MTRPTRFLHLRLGALALAAALAAGCAAAVPVTAPAAHDARTITLRGKVAIKPATFRLKALAPAGALTPWTAADVHRVKVYLRRNGGEEFFLGDHDDVNAPLTVSNLRMDTSYAVRLEAWRSDGGDGWERIDAADERCVTEFMTSNQLEETGLVFGLALAKRVFAGEASGTVAVEPGEVEDTTQGEVLLSGQQPEVILHGMRLVDGDASVSGNTVSVAAGSFATFVLPSFQFPGLGSGRGYKFHINDDQLPSGARVVLMAGTEAELAGGPFGHRTVVVERGADDSIAPFFTSPADNFASFEPGVLGETHSAEVFGSTLQVRLMHALDQEGEEYFASDFTTEDGGNFLGSLPAVVLKSLADPLSTESGLVLRFENPDQAPMVFDFTGVEVYDFAL